MTKLLVSVRNRVEAEKLNSSDIAIVDVKEPSNGSLGKAETSHIEDIFDLASGDYLVSAALGELVQFQPKILTDLPPIHFAKFGLSQVKDLGWRDRWWQATEQLHPSTQPVAVAYADWNSCGAPHPLEIASVGKSIGCTAFLLDTFDKESGCLFDHLGFAQVSLLIQQVRALGLQVVLAGGLSNDEDLRAAVKLLPEFLGVRGAVCANSRRDGLCNFALSSFLTRFRLLQNNLLEQDTQGT